MGIQIFPNKQISHYSAKYHRKRLRKIKGDEPPNEQEPAVTLVPEV